MIIFHMFQKTVRVYLDSFTYMLNLIQCIKYFSDDELGNTMIAAFISIFSSSAFEFLIFDEKKNIFFWYSVFSIICLFISFQSFCMPDCIFTEFMYTLYLGQNMCFVMERNIEFIWNLMPNILASVVDAKKYFR